MADNVAVTPGSGKTIATDEISGRHFQIIKLAVGVDGSVTLVSNTDPLPIGATTLPLPTNAMTEATGQALLNATSDLLTAMTAEIPELPPQPTQATSPFTYTKITRTSAETSNIVAAPGVGLTVRLYRYRFTCAGTVVVDIRDGSSNSYNYHDMPGAGGYEGEFWQFPYNGGMPSNSALTMTTDTTAKVVAEFWTITE